MKTGEELNALKKEFECLNRKLAALTENELQQVTGGLHNMPIKAGRAGRSSPRKPGKPLKSLWSWGTEDNLLSPRDIPPSGFFHPSTETSA